MWADLHLTHWYVENIEDVATKRTALIAMMNMWQEYPEFFTCPGCGFHLRSVFLKRAFPLSVQDLSSDELVMNFKPHQWLVAVHNDVNSRKELNKPIVSLEDAERHQQQNWSAAKTWDFFWIATAYLAFEFRVHFKLPDGELSTEQTNAIRTRYLRFLAFMRSRIALLPPLGDQGPKLLEILNDPQVVESICLTRDRRQLLYFFLETKTLVEGREPNMQESDAFVAELNKPGGYFADRILGSSASGLNPSKSLPPSQGTTKVTQKELQKEAEAVAEENFWVWIMAAAFFLCVCFFVILDKLYRHRIIQNSLVTASSSTSRLNS